MTIRVGSRRNCRYICVYVYMCVCVYVWIYKYGYGHAYVVDGYVWVVCVGVCVLVGVYMVK